MNVDLINRAVSSVTIVATAVFLLLGVFVNPGLFFLLSIPAPVVVYRVLASRKPAELPSACCPTCFGEWGTWGPITRTGTYDFIDDMSTRYRQTRTCQDCGYAEVRRVA